MAYFSSTPEQTLSELTSSPQGLSRAEAARRLETHGLNTVKVRGQPLWRTILEPFLDVFMVVLGFAAILSLIQGDTLDALIVLGIIATSATIFYVQRISTYRVLRSLQKHSTQIVEVRRGNAIIRLNATHLVPGDIISLQEGEKLPADARLLQGSNVRVDESQLTGESLPIAKQAAALTGEKELYEQSNMLFQGSFVVSGELTAVITATGNQTEFGRLAKLTGQLNTESPVQAKINTLIHQIVIVIAIVSVVVFVLALLRGIPLAEALRFVMALAVSAVPEGLPIAISVILVLAMRRMARKKALVRNMRAIETVGVITTIATDKTGTLTKNKLSVQEVWHPNGSRKNLAQTVGYSIVQTNAITHDPLDSALAQFIKKEATKQPTKEPLSRLPFDQDFALSGNLWHHGRTYQLDLKGSPEAILARSDLTEEEREAAEAQLHTFTAQGYRVIAFAETMLTAPLAHIRELPVKTRLTFVGFTAVADQLRPEARRAIRSALAAGVSVRMITGDHFETAYHIGSQLGMVTSRDQVFDARRMSTLSDKELSALIRDVRVFSRVIPEHKHRLLAMLKKTEITAMTGDGVNDVPAIANAHVGIAMGSGSHIAKDASDIILLDDNFRTIVDAMEEGRTVISNIRRMLYYLLATNTGEVLVMIGALIVGLPLPLVPVQILWVNLVTDTAMVIPLGLEPGEKDSMRRKPQKPNAPILSKTMIRRMIMVALSMAVVTLGLFAWYNQHYGTEYARTIAFCALVVMQWGSALSARSDEQSLWGRLATWNSSFYIGLLVSIILQALVVFGPLQGLLHITPVAIGDLIITGALAFATPIILVESHKYFVRRAATKPVK